MSTAQSITDALAGLDHVQNTPDQWGMGPAHELAALLDLADAVRAAQRARYDEHAHCTGCGAWMKAGHGPGCWVGAAELAEAVPQLGTEHEGYAVRAVVEGQPAEGHLPHWYVAAEGPDGWATWTVVLEHGRLLWVMPHKLSMPEGLPIDRAAALADLADLAERAQIAR
jgi:hypothetical protein